MEIKVSNGGPCQKIIKIIIPAEEIKEQYDEKLNELKNKTKLKGFRQGRVPLNVIERKYGKDLLNEMKVSFLVKGYEDAIKEHKLAPLTSPTIDDNKIVLEKGKSCEFEFSLEVHPDFELPDYKGLEAKKTEVEVTEEELNIALEDLRKHYGELAPAEEIEHEEDFIICDAKIESEGKQIWEKKNFVMQVKLANIAKISLEKELFIGKKIGDEIKKEIDLPEDYEIEEYRNKKGVCSFVIVDLKRVSLPELNDEFAKDKNCKDLEELKSKIKEEMFKGKQTAENFKIEDELMSKVLEKIEMELPQSFIDERAGKIEEEKKKVLKARKQSDEEIAKKLEEEKDKIKSDVVLQLKEYLVIEKIAKLEEVKIEESDISSYFESLGRQQGKWPNQIREYYEKQGLIEEVKFQIRKQKVLNILRENAKYD